MMIASQTEEVRRYYDRNTARFLRYGEGGAYGAIHRADEPETRRWLERFRRGWHAPSLFSPARMGELAPRQGSCHANGST